MPHFGDQSLNLSLVGPIIEDAKALLDQITRAVITHTLSDMHAVYIIVVGGNIGETMVVAVKSTEELTKQKQDRGEWL
ncbi:hypothetical protein COP2_027325 [Malus domestica]